MHSQSQTKQQQLPPSSFKEDLCDEFSYTRFNTTRAEKFIKSIGFDREKERERKKNGKSDKGDREIEEREREKKESERERERENSAS